MQPINTSHSIESVTDSKFQAISTLEGLFQRIRTDESVSVLSLWQKIGEYLKTLPDNFLPGDLTTTANKCNPGCKCIKESYISWPLFFINFSDGKEDEGVSKFRSDLLELLLQKSTFKIDLHREVLTADNKPLEKYPGVNYLWMLTYRLYFDFLIPRHNEIREEDFTPDFTYKEEKTSILLLAAEESSSHYSSSGDKTASSAARIFLTHLLDKVTSDAVIGQQFLSGNGSLVSPFFICLADKNLLEVKRMLPLFKEGSFLELSGETKNGFISHTLTILSETLPRETIEVLKLPGIPKKILASFCGVTGHDHPLTSAMFLSYGYKRKYIELCFKLVEKMAELSVLSVNMNAAYGDCPFRTACDRGLYDLAERILDLVPNPKCTPYTLGKGKNALFMALESKQKSLVEKLIKIAHPSCFLSSPTQFETYAGQNFFRLACFNSAFKVDEDYTPLLTRDCLLEIPGCGVFKGQSILNSCLAEPALIDQKYEFLLSVLNNDFTSVCSAVEPQQYEKLLLNFMLRGSDLTPLISALQLSEFSKERLTLRSQQIIFEFLIKNDDTKLRRVKQLIENLHRTQLDSCLYLLYQGLSRDCTWSNKYELLSKSVETTEYNQLNDELKKKFADTLEVLKPKVAAFIPNSEAVKTKNAKAHIEKPSKVKEKQAAALAAIEARNKSKSASKQESAKAAKTAKVLAKPAHEAINASISKASLHAAPSIAIKKVNETIKPKEAKGTVIEAKPLSLPPSKADLNLPTYAAHTVPRNGGIMVGHVNKAYIAPTFKPPSAVVPVVSESATFLALAKNHLVEIEDLVNRLKVDSKQTSLYTSMLYYSLFRFSEIMGNHAHTSTAFVAWRNWFRHQHDLTTTKGLMGFANSLIEANLSDKLEAIFSGKQIDLSIVTPPPVLELSIDQVVKCLSEQYGLIQHWQISFPGSTAPNKFSDPSFTDVPRAVLGALIHVGSLLAVLKDKGIALEPNMQKWIGLANRMAHDSGDASLATFCDVEIIKTSDAEGFYRSSSYFLNELLGRLNTNKAEPVISLAPSSFTPSPALKPTAQPFQPRLMASAASFTPRVAAATPQYVSLFPNVPTFDPLKRV